jgi:(5-formylfuran-3-yl)methyl phosphate synthase
MKILISVVSVEEARIAARANPDIVDIKNPEEGSLGAQFPWILKDITDELREASVLSSATLGDLIYKPGTASLAAYGAALCGVDYVKAGLFGVSIYNEALNLMSSIVKAVRMVNTKIRIVAAGYADYNRFGGISPEILTRVAQNAGADIVMVDTAIKDGKSIFDALTYNEIEKFIKMAHENDMQVALAGSIMIEHLELLAGLNPDIIGIRGAVCENGDRKTKLSVKKIEEFMAVAM